MAEEVRYAFYFYRFMIPFGYDEKKSASDNHDNIWSKIKISRRVAVWAHISDNFRYTSESSDHDDYLKVDHISNSILIRSVSFGVIVSCESSIRVGFVRHFMSNHCTSAKIRNVFRFE